MKLIFFAKLPWKQYQGQSCLMKRVTTVVRSLKSMQCSLFQYAYFQIDIYLPNKCSSSHSLLERDLYIETLGYCVPAKHKAASWGTIPTVALLNFFLSPFFYEMSSFAQFSNCTIGKCFRLQLNVTWALSAR